MLFGLGYPVLVFFILFAPLISEFDIALLELLVFIALFATIPTGLFISSYLVLGTLTGGFVAVISVVLKSRVKPWQFQILVFILTVFISAIIYLFFAEIFDNITRAETDIKEVFIPGIKNSVLVLVIPLLFYGVSTTWSSRHLISDQ